MRREEFWTNATSTLSVSTRFRIESRVLWGKTNDILFDMFNIHKHQGLEASWFNLVLEKDILRLLQLDGNSWVIKLLHFFVDYFRWRFLVGVVRWRFRILSASIQPSNQFQEKRTPPGEIGSYEITMTFTTKLILKASATDSKRMQNPDSPNRKCKTRQS